MIFEAKCQTTAMGIMPHTDIEKALELALSLDIPFWPQLPKISFYEDMYVQSSQNFPGIELDIENNKIKFHTVRFEQELWDYFEKSEQTETFALSREYSAVYHAFLARDLKGHCAIRGQVTGPVSFGYNIIDENRKPIIYNDQVRPVLFDFIQKKVNTQYHELKEKNPRAFVWVDEPGLGYVFSGLSGYNDHHARDDFGNFFQGVESPKGLHLCANVDPPYLLELGVEILSFDAYQLEFMAKEYTNSIAEFLRAGGIIAWGIVPTESAVLARETAETLAQRLMEYWGVLTDNTNLSPGQIVEQSLVAPARCCLRDVSQAGDETAGGITEDGQSSTLEERTVEKAFVFLKELSQILRRKYHLDS